MDKNNLKLTYVVSAFITAPEGKKLEENKFKVGYDILKITDYKRYAKYNNEEEDIIEDDLDQAFSLEELSDRIITDLEEEKMNSVDKRYPLFFIDNYTNDAFIDGFYGCLIRPLNSEEFESLYKLLHAKKKE